MTLEENKAIIRRFNEAFNKKDLTLLDDLIAPEFFEHEIQAKDLESFKQNIDRIYNGFPDVNRPIEDIIAEGDKVWMYVKGTGTHTGEYLGVAPTGKKISLSGVVIFRVADGKIVKMKSQLWDFMDLYKQIGIIEYTEKGKKLFPEDSG